MSVSASHVREIIRSESFRNLVRKRIIMSSALTAIMLAAYFGFILLIAFNRAFLSQRIGEHLTLGLPVGIGLILFAWLLTGIYTRWANRSYDRHVRELRNRVLGQ